VGAPEPAGGGSGGFLFVVWDGGGNVPPALSLGHRLAGRGHRVRVLAPPTLESRIRALGLEHRPFLIGTSPDPGPGRSLDDLPPELLGELFFGLPAGKDVAAEIERDRPDVLVVDVMLVSALAAAEASGVPTVALVHTLYSFLDGFDGMVSGALGLVNPARAELGVAPLDPAAGSLVSQLLDRCALVLAATASALDRPTRPVGPNVRFIGLQPDPPIADGPPLELPSGGPLVLVSLSTTYQHQESVLGAILGALGGLPVEAVVTLGLELDADQLPSPPPNCILRRWVPHAALLPEARVVVTHAGHGTVIAALTQGVPLVCIPMGRDQGGNAERVAADGCGVVLAATAGPDEVADAIREVLTDSAYRDAAGRMAAAIRDELAGSDPVAELERLLDQRAPAAD